MVVDLMAAYAEAQGGRGTLDYLWIVGDPGQVASQFRRMLAEAGSEYLEFSRPPYAGWIRSTRNWSSRRGRGA